MQLSELIKRASIQHLASPIDSVITGISCDSRRIQPGGIFAALPGSKKDGHDYIDAAIKAGASAILCRPDTSLPDGITHLSSEDARSAYARLCAVFWPARGKMHIAVTGTNGKTSIVEYLRQIWQRIGWPAASLGTLGARTAGLNAPGHITGIGAGIGTGGLTTPSAETLFSSIDQLAKRGITHFALEASSHGIAQDRLVGLAIHTAIFTNLSQDHLDYHEDMDSYFEAKAKLFETCLMPAAYVVINTDDSWGQKLADRLADRPVVVVRVGRDKKSDVRIINITPSDSCLLLEVCVFGAPLTYTVALAGGFQVENAVLAATAAHVSGLPVHDAFGTLPNLLPTPGRMQPIHGHPAEARIIIDYAHTPDALATALEALRAETSGQLYVVFGCGGERDSLKRPMMGAAAAKHADQIIITDDNPRSEDPAKIRAEILKACPQAEEIAPRGKAITEAIARLKTGDSLMIAGKGHETVQQIGTETLPFDDAAVARVAIQQMEGRDA